MRKYLGMALVGPVLLAIVALTAYPYLRGRRDSSAVTNAATTQAAMADDKRYSTDLKELRARFNQDKGKVRVLMLLSPT